MFDFDNLKEKKIDRLANPGPLICVENAKTPISEWKITNWHYIGRPMKNSVLYGHGSDLANPYRLEKGQEKGSTLELYSNWLHERYKEKTSSQYNELLQILSYSLELSGIALVCWCTPLPCHGHVIVRAIHYMYKQGIRP